MAAAVSMTPQAVGAYGERIIEAELLRRGWVPANFNHSVNSAAGFDIFARKGERMIPIRVKTCAAKYQAFQFSTLKGDPPSLFRLLQSEDFIALVAMGESRISGVKWTISHPTTRS